MEWFVIEDDDIFIDKYIASPEVREHIRETGTHFTDFMKAAIIYHLGRDRGFTFDETRSDMERLRDTTEDIELRQQLSERIAYDDACLERHKCNGDGFYGLYLYIDGEIYYCRQCLSFDVAYRQGCRAGEKFRITKFRYVDRKRIHPALLCDSGAGTRCINMANLYFDEHGELLYVDTFDANENEERAYGKQGRFEAVEIDIPNPFQAGDVVEVIQSGAIGVVLTVGQTQRWRWSEEQCVYFKEEKAKYVDSEEEDDSHWGHYHYVGSITINKTYARLYGNRDGHRESFKAGRRGTCYIKHIITLAIPESYERCYLRDSYEIRREWEKEWWTLGSNKCTSKFAPYHLTYSELPEEDFTLTSRCIINLLSWQAHHERVEELQHCRLIRDIYAFLAKAALVIIVILLIKILLFS